MSKISKQNSIESICNQVPAAYELFGKLDIDTCCGGADSLESACAKGAVDPAEVMRILSSGSEPSRGIGNEASQSAKDFEALSLTEFTEHIENVHHEFLWRELERLKVLTQKVASVHGHANPRLAEVREVFENLVRDLSHHMLKEEQVLFPLIREIEAAQSGFASPCGSVAHPIRMMNHEHEQADQGFTKLRCLLEDYTPPAYACSSYEAMLTGLEGIEIDLREHMRKETDILFPRAIRLESSGEPHPHSSAKDPVFSGKQNHDSGG